MLTSAERQSQIKATLSADPTPVTASKFGERFSVSRQTIVGDIALMRALGEAIIATPRGYQYEQPALHQAVIVCRHTPEQTADEMNAIVDNGGKVLDVIVDHPLYGQLRGQLQIESRGDVNMFIGHMRQHGGRLLSELTDGVHLHTVSFDKPEQLKAIKQVLRDKGYLFEEQ